MRRNTENDIIDRIHPRGLYNNLVKHSRRGKKGNLQEFPAEQEQEQEQDQEQEQEQEQGQKQK